jgi:DDE family transposase
VIFAATLPRVKAFLRPAHLPATTVGLLVRLLTAFCHHAGRMSAAAAADALRAQTRHRAAIARFLARLHWARDWSLLTAVADLLLQAEARHDGTWLFLLDQTYCGQQGRKAENTFSRANVRPRQKKGQRKNKKCPKRSCHGFVMGLLLTPSGLRIPCCRSYYTEGYCQAKNKAYRTQPELAAELIRGVAVPAGARVVVVGDTAFEAQDIRDACAQRRFSWVVPSNPERVLAGPKPRPKVTSLVAGLSAQQFAAIRLAPGQGAYAAQQRAARCRLGPKAKARVYYAHAERRAVHNVGDVLLVFSTKEQPQAGRPVPVQKVLMTNAVGWTAAEVVATYALRWQVELFFKELKSTLGMGQYRFREFVRVENWVQACLVAFVYLEWYRSEQLRRRDLPEREKGWWRWQRSHGMAGAAYREAEARDVAQLYRWSGTASGRKRLRRCLAQAQLTPGRKAS